MLVYASCACALSAALGTTHPCIQRPNCCKLHANWAPYLNWTPNNTPEGMGLSGVDLAQASGNKCQLKSVEVECGVLTPANPKGPILWRNGSESPVLQIHIGKVHRDPKTHILAVGARIVG
jgi:hypothetical protein